MIRSEDAELFVFDYDIILEEEEQDRLSGLPTCQSPLPEAESGRGRGRGRERGRGPRCQSVDLPARLICDICSKTYKNETTLNTHKKNHVMNGEYCQQSKCVLKIKCLC